MQVHQPLSRIVHFYIGGLRDGQRSFFQGDGDGGRSEAGIRSRVADFVSARRQTFHGLTADGQPFAAGAAVFHRAVHVQELAVSGALYGFRLSGDAFGSFPTGGCGDHLGFAVLSQTLFALLDDDDIAAQPAVLQGDVTAFVGGIVISVDLIAALGGETGQDFAFKVQRCLRGLRAGQGAFLHSHGDGGGSEGAARGHITDLIVSGSETGHGAADDGGPLTARGAVFYGCVHIQQQSAVMGILHGLRLGGDAFGRLGTGGNGEGLGFAVLRDTLLALADDGDVASQPAALQRDIAVGICGEGFATDAVAAAGDEAGQLFVLIVHGRLGDIGGGQGAFLDGDEHRMGSEMEAVGRIADLVGAGLQMLQGIAGHHHPAGIVIAVVHGIVHVQDLAVLGACHGFRYGHETFGSRGAAGDHQGLGLAVQDVGIRGLFDDGDGGADPVLFQGQIAVFVRREFGAIDQIQVVGLQVPKLLIIIVDIGIRGSFGCHHDIVVDINFGGVPFVAPAEGGAVVAGLHRLAVHKATAGVSEGPGAHILGDGADDHGLDGLAGVGAVGGSLQLHLVGEAADGAFGRDEVIDLAVADGFPGMVAGGRGIRIVHRGNEAAEGAFLLRGARSAAGGRIGLQHLGAVLFRGPGSGGPVGKGAGPAGAALGIPDGAAAERIVAGGGGIAAEAVFEGGGGIEGPVIQGGDAGREPDPLQILHGTGVEVGKRAVVAQEGIGAHGGGAGGDLIDFAGLCSGIGHQGLAVVAVEDAVHALILGAAADLDALQVGAIAENSAVFQGRGGGQGDGGHGGGGEGIDADAGEAGAGEGDAGQAGSAEGVAADGGDGTGDGDGSQLVASAEHILTDRSGGAQVHGGQGIAVVEGAGVDGGRAFDGDGLEAVRVPEGVGVDLGHAGGDGHALDGGLGEGVGADVIDGIPAQGGGDGDGGGGADILRDAHQIGAYIDGVFPGTGGIFVGHQLRAAQDHPDSQRRGILAQGVALGKGSGEGIFSAGGIFGEAGAGERNGEITISRGNCLGQELQDGGKVHALRLADTGQRQFAVR